MAERAPPVVVMEACGNSHYWAWEMIKLGLKVKLVAP
jgi:transposase